MQYKEYNQPKQAHPLRQGCSNYTTLSNRDRPIARNLTPDSQSAFYSADFTVRPIGAPTLPSYHHRPVTVPLMESRTSMREGVKKKKKTQKNLKVVEQMYVLYLSPIKTGKCKHLSVLCFHLPSAGLKNNRDGGRGRGSMGHTLINWR